MIEEGVVISTSDDLAVVELERGEFCKGCNACATFGDGRMCLEAKNALDAQIGDKVRVEVASKHVLSGAMLIFVLPILAMIAGYFIGQRFSTGASELPGIIGAFAGLAGVLILNRLIAPKNATTQTNAVVIGYGASGNDRIERDN